jgi:tRNA uridine 5-carbamoylmethylation protein Kti12
MMIGLPATGKTTLIKRVFNNMLTYKKTAIISSDKYIEKYAEQKGKTYSEIFLEAVKTATFDMWQEAENAKLNKNDIVWDQTNLTIAKRNVIIEWAKDLYIIHGIVFRKPDKQEYENRLNSRPGKFIPLNIIENMEKSFQEPTLSEGFVNLSESKWW